MSRPSNVFMSSFRRALDQPPVLQLLGNEAGHDGLAGTGVVRDEEPETGHLQRVVVDGLDLVRERVHLAHTDGQHGSTDGPAGCGWPQ